MKLSAFNPNDSEEINKLFIKTFSDSEGESEGLVIGELVNAYMTSTDAKDFYCFVATEGEQIIGGVFFTKLKFKSDVKAYILSPMAILTEHQGKGTGQQLINFGLKILKENGVAFVVTYGDPNYYSRVGFRQITEEIIKAPLKLSYPKGWLGQSLVSDKMEDIADKPSCVEALNKAELW